MTQKQKNFFFTADDLPIFDLSQIYMISSTWYDTGMADVWGTFDVLVRDMPPKRNFLIAAGLEEMIYSIQSWHYTDEHLRILRRDKLISPSFARYLKDFRFHGSIHAMPEGTIFFPGEPVIRITAPLIEANLFTAFLIDVIATNVPIASKYIRSIIAAKGKSVIGVSPQRSLTFEASLKGQRSSYIAGSNNQPSPVVRHRLGLSTGDHATIGYHAFITSYLTESEAMHALGEATEVDFSLMVDTYEVRQGMKNAIAVAHKIKSQGKKLRSVVIDSGNLLQLSRLARRMLDRAGLHDVRIVIASNLDEYRIARLIKYQVPADSFIVSSEASAVTDGPGIESVYKMSELIDDNGRHPKMKFSAQKVSLPGRKQVYRHKENGIFHHDVIGLETERLGQSLLVPIFEKGKLVYSIPPLSRVRARVKQQVAQLPPRLRRIDKQYVYQVRISPGVRQLIGKLKKQYVERSP